MKINLRKLDFDDLKYFTKWWRDKDLIKLTSGNFDELSDDELKKYFDEMINSKTDYHWMIEADNQTIGHINLSKRNSGWFETQIVIGKKDFLGKGFGSAAILEMIKKAKELNITQIYLEVRPDNLRAISAYKKAGFKEIKTIRYPNNPNLLETLRMELN